MQLRLWWKDFCDKLYFIILSIVVAASVALTLGWPAKLLWNSQFPKYEATYLQICVAFFILLLIAGREKKEKE